MKKITRGQLGDILSANTPTRTKHLDLREDDQEITDKWIVKYLDTDQDGVLNIYCTAPENK